MSAVIQTLVLRSMCPKLDHQFLNPELNNRMSVYHGTAPPLPGRARATRESWMFFCERGRTLTPPPSCCNHRSPLWTVADRIEVDLMTWCGGSYLGRPDDLWWHVRCRQSCTRRRGPADVPPVPRCSDSVRFLAPITKMRRQPGTCLQGGRRIRERQRFG
jgi:hypothetical protein